MPIELVYLAALLITICIFFIVLKRPIYEGMLAGFIVMLAMTNQWEPCMGICIQDIHQYPVLRHCGLHGRGTDIYRNQSNRCLCGSSPVHLWPH